MPGKPSMPAVWVSRHALDRVAEHHSITSRLDAVRLIDDSIEMAVEVVLTILRRVNAGSGDRYFLAADRRGIFVLTPSAHPGSPFLYTVVTYIRFAPSQTELVSRLYPVTVDVPEPIAVAHSVAVEVK